VGSFEIVKIIKVNPMTQATRIVALGVLVAGVGCGSSSPADIPAPVDPQATIQEFMAAVGANDLSTMGRLWGTREGPAQKKLDQRSLEQRLRLMQIYLSNESWEILDPDPSQTIGAVAGERYYRIRLTRKQCTPVVPVTVVQFGGGWLVQSVDLTEAGNPARTCPSGGTPDSVRTFTR